MASIELVLKRIAANWTTPSAATHRGEPCPFSLQCSFGESPVADAEISQLCEKLGIELPEELLEFWRMHKSAALFEDVDYGQWGLELLAPSEALVATRCFSEERSKDAVHGDLVIGRFLGDSDLLLLRCDRSADDFGSLLVALPLDDRFDWPRIAKDFGVFLDEYERNEGDKHWEIG